MKKESITGPIILIVIGSIFLMEKMMPDFNPIRWAFHWWPALLIALGVAGLLQRLGRRA